MRLRETAPWLAVLAIGLACFFAWRWLSATMFSRNPQYELRRVSIEPGYAKSEQEIRDITGLREGVNLFSFRASEVRERLLRTTPNIADAEVTKILPDAVEVVVHDRIPVASLCSPVLALDADGFVFTILPRDVERYRSLPRIENGAEPSRPPARSPTRPGRRPASRRASCARCASPCSATAPTGRSASPTST